MLPILKIKYGCLLVCLLTVFYGNSQLLIWSPDFIQEAAPTVEITCDANFGNKGLINYTPTSDVYVHIGVITNKSISSADWKYSKFTWGTTNSSAACSFLGNNKWKYTISGGLRSYFGITDASEKIVKIAILFRSGSGAKVQRNADGSDMYVPVYDNTLQIRIDTPMRQPSFIPIAEPITKNIGDNISINAKSSTTGALKLFFNGTQIATATANQISANPIITSSGIQQIIAEASSGGLFKRDTLTFFVSQSVVVADPPLGIKEGINYESGDTSVTLLLTAPNKTSVSVVGDFNNWTQTTTHQMRRSVDGKKFWLRITGLTSGVEYAYQFIIDGILKVADYNAEKILDPNNDPYIPVVNYPNLKPYPTGKTTGIISIFQTAKPVYNFTATNYVRPNKKNLTVYELLVRDFVAAQNWNTIRDSLAYLKRLGINTICIMPFNEFEGNESWGYNPSFYFAPDKMYGTEDALKAFIDSCHKMNIAVVMDIALNHSFGQSPMVQMYWDATNNIPAANSPWFNQNATHPYNVGYDFNHESQETKNFVDRVVEHWLTKYKIDGFRWDLSKGFTQTNNPNNVGAWGNYDASRVAIWKRIYDKMQAISPNSYCILEHFAANTEEIELSNYGMLLWGNSNYNFSQATMGFSTDWNFQSGIHTARSWANPFLQTYQESHDEERLMYRNLQFGNSNATYSVRDLNTALKRNEMAAAFWSVMPGPKMLWQFGELGYDYSINHCTNGTVNSNCRLTPKPIRWDYYQNPNRRALYDVYSKMLRLKITPTFFNTFTTNNVTWNLGGSIKSITLNDAALRVVVVGNFDVTTQTGSVTFPTAGTWYSYLTGTTKSASGFAESITLQPGEYYVYTDKEVANSVVTPIRNINNALSNMKVKVYPNPVKTTSNVEYYLEQSGQVSFALMDISGKKVANLFSGFKPKGNQIFELNRNKFGKVSNGVYLLEIGFNGMKKVEKIIIE